MLLRSIYTCSCPLLVCSAYKSSAADSLLAERGRIDSSHQMTDTIIQYVVADAHRSMVAFLTLPHLFFRQAYETRSEFGRQRANIASINTRMVKVIGAYTPIILTACVILTTFTVSLRYDAWHQQPHWHDQVTAEAGFSYFGTGDWCLYDSAIDLCVELSSSMGFMTLIGRTDLCASSWLFPFPVKSLV